MWSDKETYASQTVRGASMVGQEVSGERTMTTRLQRQQSILLSREERLLVACARLKLTADIQQAVRQLLADGLDWELLLDKATWHRLSPLVSYHLTRQELSGFVPPMMLARLKRIRYASLARNILLQNELSLILSAFEQRGIRVIVLKGAAMLGSIYPDISLRPMNDLDILVAPRELHAANAIALNHGFAGRVDNGTHHGTPVVRKHLPYLINQKKGIILEIHQHIVNSDSPYHFPLDIFWERAQPIEIAGTPALAFAPEDLLLHLGIKFLVDRRLSSNSALGQLCDITEVARKHGNRFNWDSVGELASEHGIAPGLSFVLYTCRQLLDLEIPDSAVQKMQPNAFDSAIANLFVRRRVLDTASWLPLDIAAPRKPYSVTRSLYGALRRLVHHPTQVSRGRNSRLIGRMRNLMIAKEILSGSGSVVVRPKRLRQDLLLDRWLHDLNGSGKDQDRSRSSRVDGGWLDGIIHLAGKLRHNTEE